MSSLHAIFDHAQPYTRAHYTVAGVTYAIVVNLPAEATNGQMASPQPHFRLQLLQGSDVRELVVTPYDVTALLASCEPPIPSQEGWALGAPGTSNMASDTAPDG